MVTSVWRAIIICVWFIIFRNSALLFLTFLIPCVTLSSIKNLFETNLAESNTLFCINYSLFMKYLCDGSWRHNSSYFSSDVDSSVEVIRLTISNFIVEPSSLRFLQAAADRGLLVLLLGIISVASWSHITSLCPRAPGRPHVPRITAERSRVCAVSRP